MSSLAMKGASLALEAALDARSNAITATPAQRKAADASVKAITAKLLARKCAPGDELAAKIEGLRNAYPLTHVRIAADGSLRVGNSAPDLKHDPELRAALNSVLDDVFGA